MNPRIIRALLFEQVFRTTPMLVVGFCTGVLAVFAIKWLGAGTFDDDEAAAIGQMTAFCIAIGVLFYTNASADRVTCGIPASTLMLPVSTATIVAVRYLWGALAIVSISVCVQKVALMVLDSGVLPWWKYSAIALASFAILQVIAFSLSRWNDLSLLGLIISVFAVGYAVFGVVIELATTNVMLLGFTGTVFVVSACAACGVVTLQRREATLDLANWLPFTVQIRRRDIARPPFRSARAAQRWLETVRLCSSFPALFLGLLGLSFLLEYGPNIDPANTYSLLLGGHHLDHPEFFTRCLIGSAAAAGAITAFLNFRLLNGPLRSFYFIRPMSTRDLASARLLSTIRILLVPLCFLGVWLLGAVVIDVRELYLFNLEHDPGMETEAIVYLFYDEFIRRGSDAMQFFMSTLSYVWMLFWTSLVAAALGVFVLAGTLFDAASNRGWVDDNHAGILITMLAVVYLVAMMFMVRRALRLGLLNKRLLNTALSAGFVLTLILVGLVEINHSFLVAQGTVSAREIAPFDYVRNNGISFLFALAFSTLPFAAVPLTLHWNRHR